MSASQISVYNLALTKLGQDRVSSASENVESARVISSLWDLARDAVLARHPWRFAIVRDSLPAISTAPAFGFSSAYVLPEKCLRLVQVSESWVFYAAETEFYTIESAPDGSGYRAILTDEGAPLSVRYVTRVENVGLWPALFCRAMAMQLALDAREKIAPNVNAQDIGAEYELSVRQAKQQNGIEMPPTRPIESTWLSSRGD